MEEAKEWTMKNHEEIDEQDCPKFDMVNPKEVDLKECESICINHWACHTWRHLRGTRIPREWRIA